MLSDLSPEASYRAAAIAADRRLEIIARRGDLVAETVFSDPSKLDLVRQARAGGYAIWVMQHVGVDSADLSVARVAHRVGAGGHGVSEAKIRERYVRSEALIRKAILDKGLGGAGPVRCWRVWVWIMGEEV